MLAGKSFVSACVVGLTLPTQVRACVCVCVFGGSGRLSFRPSVHASDTY